MQSRQSNTVLPAFTFTGLAQSIVLPDAAPPSGPARPDDPPRAHDAAPTTWHVVTELPVDPGIDPYAGLARASVAEFFEAIRTCVLSRPWDVLDERTPVGIDIPELGFIGGCAVLLRDAAGDRGIVVFPSYEGYRIFFENCAGAAASTESCAAAKETPLSSTQANAPCSHDSQAATSSFSMIHFFSWNEISLAAAARMEKHELRVANRDSYPLPEMVTDKGVTRLMTKRDLRLLSSVAAAIGDLCLFHREKVAAGEPVQALVEGHDLPRAIVECPHPEWTAPLTPKWN